jgi:hypothetical protein
LPCWLHFSLSSKRALASVRILVDYLFYHVCNFCDYIIINFCSIELNYFCWCPKMLKAFSGNLLIFATISIFPQTLIDIVKIIWYIFLIYTICVTKSTIYKHRMTESYNLRTSYKTKLQFTRFVWWKTKIYVTCITKSCRLPNFYDRNLQYTHFLWQKSTISAFCKTEN